MTKDVKYYRDLQPSETLRAGDEWRARHWSATTWHTIPANSAEVGHLILPGFKIDYRRPVNLPVLQPVTPEAMAELERREVIGVLFVDGYGVQVASYNRYRGWWWCGGIGKLDRPTRGWFIELSTIPEVQQ